MIKSTLTRRKPIGQRSAVLKSTKPKTRKCTVKGCGNRFAARNLAHKACGPECAALVSAADRKQREAKAAREERAETKAKRDALKTRSDWLKEAQAVFNAWVRARDAHQPCISCGQFHDRFWDAGHYRSVGAQPALRFHEDNVHKQCVHCNQHKGGNVVEYRLRLIERIGAKRVAFLEQEHAPAKYTIEDAKRIKAEYAAKLRALKEQS